MFQKYFPQAQFLKEQNMVYLDSAATTLKPLCVTQTLNRFYSKQVSNVHRGDHQLSNALTWQYENTRAQIQRWIQAQHPEEVIFTKSTTEGINFLSFALQDIFKPEDAILLTEMEHHSNLLPWYALAKRKNLKLKFLPVDKIGELALSEWKTLTNKKTKLFAFTYYSNALGTRNPVEKLCAMAKQQNILTFIDAAQAMTAEPVNVQNLDCDFLAFSGHKLFAPAGVGALYVKKEQFSKLKPWQLGGGMVTDVSLNGFEPADTPQCFEAGTPPVEQALALGAVLDFLSAWSTTPTPPSRTQQQPTPHDKALSLSTSTARSGPAVDFFATIKKNKTSLLTYAEEELKKIPGIQVIGQSPSRVNILSFVLQGAHCRDVGQLISQSGVAVRSGHHCCLPLMKKLNLLSGTVRASFSIYNDEQDVEQFISAVKKAKEILL